jgi:hypothetical protein
VKAIAKEREVQGRTSRRIKLDIVVNRRIRHVYVVLEPVRASTDVNAVQDVDLEGCPEGFSPDVSEGGRDAARADLEVVVVEVKTDWCDELSAKRTRRETRSSSQSSAIAID